MQVTFPLKVDSYDGRQERQRASQEDPEHRAVVSAALLDGLEESDIDDHGVQSSLAAVV